MMNTTTETYTIKEISEMTGVSIHTLRYYERIGLIDMVDRADNGHRRYTEKDFIRVDFLKRLRATGMPISQMQHYVDLFRAGDSTLQERRLMLEAHRQIIQEQIDALTETRAMIDGKITRYRKQEQDLLEDTFESEQTGD